MKKISILVLTSLLLMSSVFAADVKINLEDPSSTSSFENLTVKLDKNSNLDVTYSGTEKMNYILSGSFKGTVIFNSDNADYSVTLNGVDIKATTLPAMQLKSTTNATVILTSDKNFIADSADNEKKGAITSGGSVIFEGSGSLNLSVFKKHGLKIDNGIIMNSGNITINGDEKAEGNMISADNFFILNGGNLTINAMGSVYCSESKGIKVNGVEGTGAGLGYIEINNGNLVITSVGKAITAGWDIDEDATTSDTSDDPKPIVTINGGNLLLTTTGKPFEISETESLSPEGIEGKDSVIINGGIIYVFTTDDSINAANLVQINGGYVYARSSANDSIDSNRYLEINGGTIIALGSYSPEQGLDCDNDSNFSYTGGIFFAGGSGNNMPKNASTSAYSIAFGNAHFEKGSQVAIVDKDGNLVLGFTVPDDYEYLSSAVFGSTAFKKGQTYTLVSGKISDTDSSEDVDTLTTSGSIIIENVYQDFTVTDYTSSVGQIGMSFGGFGGQRGNQGNFNRQVPPEGFDGRMPEGFDGHMPENFDGRMPENFDGRMPEGFDGRMPENFDGRMPEDIGDRPFMGFEMSMFSPETQQAITASGLSPDDYLPPEPANL